MPIESPGNAALAAAVAQATTPTPTASAPAPVEAPVVAAPVQAAAAPVIDPNVVPVPKAMYEELIQHKATVAKLEADRQAAESARKEAELKSQLEKGQFQEVLASIKKQADDTANLSRAQLIESQQRAERYALSSQLNTALANQPLVKGGAAQLAALWEKEFVVESAGDTYAVRTKDLRSVNDFVAAKLASEEFAHFVRASSTGGTGASHAASQSVPTPAQTAAQPVPQPATMGEAALLDWKSMQSTQVDGRLAQGRDASGKKIPIAGFGFKRSV